VDAVLSAGAASPASTGPASTPADPTATVRTLASAVSVPESAEAGGGMPAAAVADAYALATAATADRTASPPLPPGAFGPVPAAPAGPAHLPPSPPNPAGAGGLSFVSGLGSASLALAAMLAVLVALLASARARLGSPVISLSSASLYSRVKRPG